jgi:tRNA(Arg) A34 adenosine deaminase TadA
MGGPHEAARRTRREAQAQSDHPQQQYIDLAEVMRQAAVAARDQSYGAVLVLGDQVVGEAPSRVMLTGDPLAHAEREAIREAQKRLGRTDLAGAVLYSTSPPCPMCRQVAAQARVARMYFGSRMADGGMP